MVKKWIRGMQEHMYYELSHPSVICQGVSGYGRGLTECLKFVSSWQYSRTVLPRILET